MGELPYLGKIQQHEGTEDFGASIGDVACIRPERI